jgi:hypothetical protein
MTEGERSPSEEGLFLGTLSNIRGYTLTVVAESEEAAKKALVEEYRRWIKENPIHHDLPTGTDPLEYFAVSVTEMTPGKVEWL